jgi:hypothetical protein
MESPLAEIRRENFLNAIEAIAKTYGIANVLVMYEYGGSMRIDVISQNKKDLAHDRYTKLARGIAQYVTVKKM